MTFSEILDLKQGFFRFSPSGEETFESGSIRVWTTNWSCLFSTIGLV